MSQRYPIWITNLPELDLVYEGLHHLLRHDHRSCLIIQNDITKIERELAWYIDQGVTDEETLLPLKRELKDKKAIFTMIGEQVVRAHMFLKRLSDPSVPAKLIDEYVENKRREGLMKLIEANHRALDEHRKEREGK